MMRRPAAVLVVIAVCVTVGLALLPIAPVHAAPVQPKDTFAVGDSVMLGARWVMRLRGMVVDAQVSRQATSGPALLRDRGSRLPRNVVVHLGTNGTFLRSTCDRVMRIAGPRREVFWVTVWAPRRWIPSNNKVLRACAARYPGRAHIVDWAWAAARHPSWLYSDGIHLRPAGARAFARIVRTAIDREHELGTGRATGPNLDQ